MDWQKHIMSLARQLMLQIDQFLPGFRAISFALKFGGTSNPPAPAEADSSSKSRLAQVSMPLTWCMDEMSACTRGKKAALS